MIKFNKKKIKALAKQYQLADVYIFGLQLNGFARKDSDLDLAVRFQKGLPDMKARGQIYGKLFVDLSSCFSGQKLDLVFIEEAPLHFQYKIFTQGQMIFSQVIFSQDKENSFNFQERIFNLYRDYKYFIDEFFQGALAAV